MEKNKENKKFSLKNPNLIIPLISYILLMFLIGSIFIIACIYITSKIDGTDSKTCLEMITKSNYDKYKGTKEYWTFFTGYGFGQTVIYLILFLIVIFYMRNYLKEDFIDFKNRKYFFLWYIPLSILLFLIIVTVVSYISNRYSDDSENQKLIEEMLKSNGKIPMIISTAIFAPVVEELIFRKLIHRYTINLRIVLFYVISVTTFTLIHVLSSDITDFKNWLIISIPYITSAILFCTIYHVSKFNIYATMIVHISNNLLAIILLFI